MVALYNDDRFTEVDELYKGMLNHGVIPDHVLSTHCSNALARMAFQTFHDLDQMAERGMKPSVTIYDSSISCLSREKRLYEAETLFQRMLDSFRLPSSHAYAALVSGLVKSDMTDKGCKYLDRMLEDGFVPNDVVYNSLFYHFLRKRKFEFALRLDRSQIEFDLIFCTALVSGVCRNIVGIKKRWCSINRASERAREMLLQLLYQRKFSPRETILRFCADSSEHMKCFALKLMRRIKGTNYMPNLIENAYNEFEFMQEERICPNEVTFTILIGAHSRADQIDRAIELFNLMNAGEVLQCWERVTSFVSHKQGFSRNLLHCFCACYFSIPAFKIFEEMLAHNYVPRRYSAIWLLCTLFKEKKLNEAHKLWEMMHKRGKFPNALTGRILMQDTTLEIVPKLLSLRASTFD
ncbi:hypothetical protein P3X46_006454 [Hevea brasiliensis]|uniref:Pentacotripeptide-repeat region of PRORP domain-containing protein n=1 Tax=Hevea brasiliensis TaxID=3981 RepID=A0ABQ9MQ92_HEVBR|nr:hypothetical protein P3X46_006454 [Hevea brasiliensis]